ncbi:hypothetical protein CMQ_5046 [Grosmannia clavigera kw1407]|uniref:Uncharacterized protein n=1 Tax=Grosmannia clavigera (strain kw1407 / UAMH 11150) TaxID=655863 RepID=F0XK01_GROCL|nr:uncharacterized protein CMQ_5046 [Grosmannia clavigera kw1407]EFX01975.1 hypothetical protein CMQ_5046 [Grosmannia clavigera kw1407]
MWETSCDDATARREERTVSCHLEWPCKRSGCPGPVAQQQRQIGGKTEDASARLAAEAVAMRLFHGAFWELLGLWHSDPHSVSRSVKEMHLAGGGLGAACSAYGALVHPISSCSEYGYVVVSVECHGTVAPWRRGPCPKTGRRAEWQRANGRATAKVYSAMGRYDALLQAAYVPAQSTALAEAAAGVESDRVGDGKRKDKKK